MTVSLATLRARIRNDLPVVAERMAFSQGRNDNGDESGDEKGADGAQTELVASFPEALRHALEKLGDGKLCGPDAVHVLERCLLGILVTNNRV